MKYNFDYKETYLTESFFDDLENDLDNSDIVSKQVSDIHTRMYIEDKLKYYNLNGDIEEDENYFKIYFPENEIFIYNPNSIADNGFSIDELLTNNIVDFYRHFENLSSYNIDWSCDETGYPTYEYILIKKLNHINEGIFDDLEDDLDNSNEVIDNIDNIDNITTISLIENILTNNN